MTKIAVGVEYVAGAVVGEGLAPLLCNTQYSPQHPCRVTVLSVGRVYAKVMLTGYNKPQPICLDMLWPVDDAKASYRRALEARDAHWASSGARGLGQAKINKLVESL